jgi:hypothetical protein
MFIACVSIIIVVGKEQFIYSDQWYFKIHGTKLTNITIKSLVLPASQEWGTDAEDSADALERPESEEERCNGWDLQRHTTAMVGI